MQCTWSLDRFPCGPAPDCRFKLGLPPRCQGQGQALSADNPTNGELLILCGSLLVLAQLIVSCLAWIKRRRIAAERMSMRAEQDSLIAKNGSFNYGPQESARRAWVRAVDKQAAQDRAAKEQTEAKCKLWEQAYAREEEAQEEEARRRAQDYAPPGSPNRPGLLPPCLTGCTHRWVKEPLRTITQVYT